MSKKTAIAVRKALSATGEMTIRAQTRTEILAASRTTMQKTSQNARAKAMSRDIVLSYIDELQELTDSLTLAVELLLTRAMDNKLPAHIHTALKECASGKSRYPSRSAICGWHKAKRENGLDGLVSKHKGRQRNEGGWEALATKLYNQPSKPTASSVHKILTEQHFFLCSYAQVVNYLNSLPAQLGKKSAARLGKNLHRLTQQSYVRRTTENLRAGDIYVADGYRADVYLAHPITGRIFRPELTVSMDLRSRYIVGWRLDEHEGSFVVQSMWAETLVGHKHVPIGLYIDNGSGYKNYLMDDELVGFYMRAGIQYIIHSIPGNPHGKGWIERFFRTMKEDFLKNWMPEFYCGHDMAAEVKNRVVREINRDINRLEKLSKNELEQLINHETDNAIKLQIKSNIKERKLQLPSVKQFTDAFNDWLERYHSRPHPEVKDETPKALWSELVPVPPAMSVFELKRSQIKVKVSRASVTFSYKKMKTSYEHETLYAFNGQEVLLEYDMMDNSVGIIRTLSGIWICDAHLVTPIDAIPVNRLEAGRIKRASDAVKLIDKKRDEQVARSGNVIDAAVVAHNALEDMNLIDDTDTATPALDLTKIDY